MSNIRALLLILAVPFLFIGKLNGQDLTVKKQNNSMMLIPDIVRNQLELVLKGDQTIGSIIPLVETLSRQDPRLALYIVEKLSNDERNKKYSKNWAILLYYSTWLQLDNYSENEELELLQENVQECIIFFEEDRTPYWLVKCYSLLSDIAYNISYNNDDSLYTTASIANEEALKLILENDDEPKQSYSVLGEIYRVKGNICYVKANCPIDSVFSDYDKGLEYFILNSDRSGEAMILLNKAIAFAKLEFEKDALTIRGNPVEYYEKAINTCEDNNDLLFARLEFAKYLQDKFYDTQDEYWSEQSNFQLEEILKSKESEKTDAYFQLAMNAQTYLAYFETTLSKTTASQLLDSVVYFYEKTLSSCKNENNLKVYNVLFDRLAEVCPYFPQDKCSQLLTAAAEVKTYFMKKNKTVNQAITSRNKAFKTVIEEQKRWNMQLKYLFFSAIAIIGFLFLFQWQRTGNLRKTLAIKQEALRAQMNPHFISNTMNAIESLVNQERNDEASEYLIDFSRLCRLVIDHSRRKKITLQEEVDTLKYFLSLEKLRLADDLEYTISVDNQLKAEQIMVPPLMLQPFVENAIWHGIKNKSEPKRGELKIEINKISSNVIECIIEDNGVGREKAKMIQKESVIDQKSWGMKLTQERIKHLKKGSNAGLEVEDLYSEDHQARGTKVKIQLPITIKKQA